MYAQLKRDLNIVYNVSGSGTRHVIQAQPKDSEREPLYWPGENFFDQVRNLKIYSYYKTARFQAFVKMKQEGTN